MEASDSLLQKKIKFFCPILDTSTHIPSYICYKMYREWNTTAGIKRNFRTQYVINDNGFIRPCTARYQSKRATEDSELILTVDYSAVSFFAL